MLFAGSVCVGFLVAEIGLHVTGYGQRFQAIQQAGQFPLYYHLPNAEMGYDIAPNYPPSEIRIYDYVQLFGTGFPVSSNAIGCRDRDSSGEGRSVLLLGDSFTWGNVPLEATFGTILEQHLGMRVHKCGVSGYGTRQERHKLERVVDHIGTPHVVVVGYFVGNDLNDDYLFPEYSVIDGMLLRKVGFADPQYIRGDRRWYTDDEVRHSFAQYRPDGQSTPIPSIKQSLSRHFMLYNVLNHSTALRRLASRLGLADPPKLEPTHNPERPPAMFYDPNARSWLNGAWSAHLDNLAQLKQSVESQGARLLIVLIPTLEQVYEAIRPSQSGVDWEYPNRRLNRFLNEQGVGALDLLGEFRKHARASGRQWPDPVEDLYWPFDRHLNLKGNRFTGLLIARYLLEQRWANPPDRQQRLQATKAELSEFYATEGMEES
jgi:hypothetical protein